jgi:hypothetical protein
VVVAVCVVEKGPAGWLLAGLGVHAVVLLLILS